MKALVAAALLALSATPISAQTESLVKRETESSVTCHDADGKELEIRKCPKRVVVCYTSFVSLWHLAGGSAVGMVDSSLNSKLPKACREIPLVGGFSNPNAERILSLNPDFMLLSSKVEKHRALRDMLLQRGIQCALLDYKNYKDFAALLDLFARINGKKIEDIPDAAKLVKSVDATLARAKGLKGPRFMSLFASARGVSAEADDGNAACMASMLGGENLCKGASGGSKFSMERMLLDDPDVILFTTMGDSEEIQERMRVEMMSDPLWAKLKAAKSGRVHFLPNELFLYKPNERFPEAFLRMAKLLHPERKWD